MTRRLMILRWTALAVAAELAAFAAPRAGAADPAARIQQIQSREEILPGPWSQGTFGDWKFTTERFELVVAGENGQDSMGRILDAVWRADPLDELHGLEPVALIGDSDPIRLSMREARIESPDAQTERLILSGSVEGRPGILASTEYELDAAGEALRVTTALTNGTTQTLYNIALGDMAEWALFAPFAPYFGLPDPNQEEVTYSPWVGARIDRNSLGVVLPEGMIEATHSLGRTLLRYSGVHEWKRGETLKASRLVYVGGARFTDFTDFALRARGEKFGTVTGRILQEDGTPAEGVNVAVQAFDTDEPLERPPGAPTVAPAPFSVATSGADGTYAFLAPAGKVACQVLDPTRVSRLPATFPFVDEGQITQISDLQVSAVTTLGLRVVDARTGEPLPSRAAVLPLSGTYPLNFGPPNETRGTRNVWYLPRGEAEIPLPRDGAYEVTISRGLEYQTFKFTVTTQPGRRAEHRIPLQRVVDTAGYIAVDLSAQTSASPPASVSPRDLVVAAAGEGVEWLVSADAGLATDLRPAIQAEGLELWLGATRGLKVEPRTRDLPGDLHVIPANLGAGERFEPDYLESANPGAVLRQLRTAFPDALLFVNRPLLAPNGYFRNIDFNVKEGTFGDSPDAVADFDLLGLYDGLQFDSRHMDQRLYDQMLKQGRLYTPVGASSSREIYGNEPGYPRLYVATPSDNPAEVNEADLLESLRRGAVVLTNGPFVRFEVEGQGPGSLVQAKDGAVTASLKIMAIPEIFITRYVISQNGRFMRMLSFPVSDAIQRYPFGDRPETFQIEVKEDVALQVVARGERGPMPLIPAVHGRSANQYDTLAMTAPIYVDADGDGKYTPASEQ